MTNYNLFLYSNDTTVRFNKITARQLSKMINQHLEKNPIKKKGYVKWTAQLTYNYFNRPFELGAEWFKLLKIESSKYNYRDDFTSTIKSVKKVLREDEKERKNGSTKKSTKKILRKNERRRRVEREYEEEE